MVVTCYTLDQFFDHLTHSNAKILVLLEAMKKYLSYDTSHLSLSLFCFQVICHCSFPSYLQSNIVLDVTVRKEGTMGFDKHTFIFIENTHWEAVKLADLAINM